MILMSGHFKRDVARGGRPILFEDWTLDLQVLISGKLGIPDILKGPYQEDCFTYNGAWRLKK